MNKTPKTRRPSKATYCKATRILDETMRPWRPAALFAQAFTPALGHPEPIGREAERFREHFVEEPGIMKSGPWYALSRWFLPNLPMVTEDDFILIPLSGNYVRSAQFETMRRLPYMVTRNPQADPAVRTCAALNGFTVEWHVKEYFKAAWPESYTKKSNECNYQMPAPDDFSLTLNGKRWLVDAASSDEKSPPKWRIVGGKMKGAHIRIIAFYNEAGIVLQGYTRGYSADLYPIERLIVRLNVQKIGADKYFGW